MAQTAPPTIEPSPPAPDRADRATFSSRATNWSIWVKDHAVAEFAAVATNVYNNAVDTYNSSLAAASSVVAAASSADAAATSATIAGNASGATGWVDGATYSQHAVAISLVDFQSYRKITASSVTSIDPSSDPTNWCPQGWMRTVTVTTTSATATPGQRLILTNIGATTVTAPTPVEGVEFEVVPANSLKTNIVDFGAKSVSGPGGTVSGAVTLNLGAPLKARFNATLDKWVAV